MSIHWGVDSAAASNFVKPDPDFVGQTTFDYVVAKSGGEIPEFWGRYLGGRNEITRNEIKELHTRHCSILLVYHGLEAFLERHENRPDRLPGRHAQGERAARDAIRRATNFGVPPGVRIYVDLEDWLVSADWIRGWCDTMQASQFAGMGGFYGKTVRMRESPDLIHFGQRRRGAGVLQRGPLGNEIVSETWGTSYTRASNFRPPNGSSYNEHELDALTLHGRKQANTWSRYIWSNEPMQIGDPPPDQLKPPTFSPATPTGGGQAVIWQYREYVYNNGIVSVDLDLASEIGFREMWHPMFYIVWIIGLIRLTFSATKKVIDMPYLSN